MGLVVRDRGARRASTLLAILLAVIGLVGVAMISVAALSVAHGFFMIVWTRRRDIGLLRAVGATRRVVLGLFTVEAVVVGALSGLLGVLVGLGVIRLADRLAASSIPDFPYKPESFFALPWWLALAAVTLAVLACVLGALVPVWRASRRDPADVLTIPG
jgi:ABC-type antimicrobial peptide transport system permease subunit